MNKRTDENATIKKVGRFFAFFIFLLIVNIVYLCVSGKGLISQENIRDYNKERGGGRVTKIDYATRGTIYSSGGEVIAKDVKRYNLYAILSKTRTTADHKPAYVVNKEKTAAQLAKILGANKDYLLKKLDTKSYQVSFGNVGNNLSSIVKAKIEALNLPGLEFTEVSSRNYTFGDFASYEVGYASNTADDSQQVVGKMGLEKSYNDYLTGTNGKVVYLRDSKGNTLPNGVLSKTSSVSGNDVHLTIDSDLQTQLDSLMRDFVGIARPRHATAAIMEAKTGRMLAVSNYPSFDPNKRNMKSYNDLFLNGAYECGSVFKPFVYGNALTDKVLDINDYYQSGSFYYKGGTKPIRDVNKVGWGTITFAEGLYRSSNTAICNILKSHTNMKSLVSDYNSLGFFKPSTVDGLACGSGVAAFDGKTKNAEWYTTGFGQGSSVTPFQLLRAYSAFANDGKMVSPYFVDSVVNSRTKKNIYTGKTVYSEKIFSSSAVKTVKYLLYGVTHNKAGTVHSYYQDSPNDIIGKSGTGQVVINGAYSKSINSHSFCGMAPYNNPKVVFMITWVNATNNTKDAATVLKGITKSALNKLNESSKKVKTISYNLPNFMNQSVTYAKSQLSKAGLSPIVIGDGTSVIGQYPDAKTTITNSTRVMFATNGAKITMPSMVGWSRKEAEAFGSLAGVNITVSGAGTIYKQNVEKGTTLKSKQTIKVYAS